MAVLLIFKYKYSRDDLHVNTKVRLSDIQERQGVPNPLASFPQTEDDTAATVGAIAIDDKEELIERM